MNKRRIPTSRRIRDDKKAFVQEVVGTVCIECGEERPEAIMYHHPNGATERYGMKQRPLLTFSWERLKDEVMCLIALCGTCHLMRHRRGI